MTPDPLREEALWLVLDVHRQEVATCSAGDWTPFGPDGTTWDWHLAAALAAAVPPAPDDLDVERLAALLGREFMKAGFYRPGVGLDFAIHQARLMLQDDDGRPGIVREYAALHNTGQPESKGSFTISPPAQTDLRVLGGTRPNGSETVAREALGKARKSRDR